MADPRVSVIGAGSWGTTFAVRLAQLGRGRTVTLYEHFPDIAKDIQKRRVNRLFLPGVKLPPTLAVSNDLALCIREAEIVFNAVPTQFIRPVYGSLADSKNPAIWRGKTLVNLSKGIEIKTGKPISRLFQELFPRLGRRQYVVLSGPSHAEEVILGIPTAVVAAGPKAAAERIQKLVADRRFRLYTNPDVVGVELAAALKNCIAIAAGICVGSGFGDNTLAAIITRGLAEIARLGVALGARRETFAGLAGLGDLVVTCGSRHSRNRRFGELLASGQTSQHIIKTHRFVAEGVATSKAAVRIAKKTGVEIPIIQEVYNIIYKGKAVRRAVESLLARPIRPERI